MKRFLSFLCAALFFQCFFASAESTAITGNGFSITLPEGIEQMEDSEGYTSAALSDYGESIETLLLAGDAAQIRLVALTSTPSEDTAEAAADTSATALLGNSDTVTTLSSGSNQFAGFSCSIDSVNYDFYFLSNGTTVYCLTFAGLTQEEEEETLATFTLQ